MSQVIQTTKKEEPVEYIPFGASQKIKLSLAIIRNYIAEPAIYDGKTELPDDRQCLKFMMLCRARQLDPFEGDAFMIPFYDKRKQCNVWSLITAHNAFMKRGELHPEYNGKKSGIIISPAVRCRPCSGEGIIRGEDNSRVCPVCNGRGYIDELEGDFLPDQIDETPVKLAGGWAKVFFKKRENPEYQRLKLASYAKQFGLWLSDPAGMICKCAEAAALRAAFPNTLGGMYLKEEMTLNPDLDLGGGFKRPEFSKPSATPQLENGTEPAPPAPAATEPAPEQPKAEPQPPPDLKNNPVKVLRTLCKGRKIKEQELIDFMQATGMIQDGVDSIESIAINEPETMDVAIKQFADIAGRLEEARPQ